MEPSSQDMPILSVSQLTNAIKHCLESSFPFIWLQGEISNFKLQSSGHLYFSLKDANAQISAVMFRGAAAQLKMTPKDGAQVIVQGEINVYPPSGKYQIIVKEMKLVGLGELLVKLEELKIKLHKRGWFRTEHKKALPHLPRRIGVVTSPTGAAIQDILNILSRRFSGFHLILNPVRVQGEEAAREIAQAIKQFNEHDLVDVMIIGRGGGSIEDLWAFNEEIVADAIFHSRIPVISAVGHETDHCIADYVADVRAPTPSAAAEIVIAEKTQQIKHLTQIQRRLDQAMLHLVRHYRHHLQSFEKHPSLRSPYSILGLWMQKLDSIKQDADQRIFQNISRYRLLLNARQKHLESLKPTTLIAHNRQKLDTLSKNLQQSLLTNLFQCRQLFSSQIKYKQLDQAWKRMQQLRMEKLKGLSENVKTINPKNLLSKGYSILFSEKDHSVITSIHQVKKQQDVCVVLSDGQLISTIKDVVYSE